MVGDGEWITLISIDHKGGSIFIQRQDVSIYSTRCHNNFENPIYSTWCHNNFENPSALTLLQVLNF